MLLGREAERAAIDKLCAGARVGQSGVLVIAGEPGIGKTALLEHAAARTTGMRVLRGVGSASEREVAFGGLLQLLRPALGLLDLIPRPQAEALGAALELHEGRPGDRFAIGAATLSLLSAYAEEQPLLVLVDDLHELDRPSVDALAFAGRRLLTDRIALLAAVRPDQEPEQVAALPHLVLGGLRLPATRQLLTETTSGPGPLEDLVHRVHLATGGNPLAMLELAADSGDLARLSPEVPLPVPEVLAESFRRRVTRLDPRAQAALLLAVVADGDLAVLAGAGPVLDTGPADLDPAEAAGLLTVVGGEVRFRHPVVRSSVYAAAEPGQRRRAHRAVADVLPAADLDRRTWHRSEATAGFDEELALDLERVADRAATRRGHAVAATALERAALHTEDPRHRAGRLLLAADAAWLAGQAERALALMDSSGRLTEDPLHGAAVDALRGSVASHTGSLREARDLLTGAARRMSDTDPATAARLLADAVMTCLWMGDVAGARRAGELLEALDPGQLDERAEVLVALGTGVARVLAGEPGISRIRVATERLAGSGQSADDPRRPWSAVLGVLFLRESATGRHLLEQTVQDLRSRTALASLPSLLLHVARDESTGDRWRQGVSHYEECIALAREVGHTTELTMALAGLAGVLARMGREEECRRAADEAIGLAARYDVHLARVWSEAALGDLALALDRPDEALRRYRTLAGTLERIGLEDVDVFPGPELVETLARLDRVGEARDLATHYHADARAKGQPWACARAERARAVLAAGAEAEPLFRRALDLHRESPDLFEEARTRLAFGSSLRRQRRRVDARPQLRAAVESFERIGADPWADHAARELAATGEAPVRTGHSVLDLLTAQELQVARMLAAGRTTRETAAALFLSPKTVEYHLRKVYTKLGIHSRNDLATVLGAAAAGE